MPLITAVFDTNIILQAILSDKGPAMACVQFVLDDLVELVSTDAITAEILGIVSRPSLVAKYPQLEGKRPMFVIDSLLKKATLFPPPSRKFVLERDAADEVFVNLAIGAGADFIVTRDQDILDLSIDSEFCSRFPGLRIVSPVGFLEFVRAK